MPMPSPAAGGWRRASGEFAVARFSRLYPLYLVLLIYMLLRGPMRPPLMTQAGFPLLLAYLTSTWTWWPFMLNGELLLEWYFHISWSVSTEIFFYIVYVLVLYRIARLTGLRRRGPILPALPFSWRYQLFDLPVAPDGRAHPAPRRAGGDCLVGASAGRAGDRLRHVVAALFDRRSTREARLAAGFDPAAPGRGDADRRRVSRCRTDRSAAR
jgi:peptidoglycan/LPS O-acetylase OafA/YrhL